jgi:hypothetical protein
VLIPDLRCGPAVRGRRPPVSLQVHDEVLRDLDHLRRGVRVRSPRTTYIRTPNKVTVSKKSQASRAWAWEHRKSAQVLQTRSGAGSIPACFSIPQAVEAATSTPSTSSSPWILRYPQ